MKTIDVLKECRTIINATQYNDSVDRSRFLKHISDAIAHEEGKEKAGNKLKEFIDAQKPLPADFAHILHDNFWELLDSSYKEPAPVEKPYDDTVPPIWEKLAEIGKDWPKGEGGPTPKAWISFDVITLKERIDALPIQSLNPLTYKHTPLYLSRYASDEIKLLREKLAQAEIERDTYMILSKMRPMKDAEQEDRIKAAERRAAELQARLDAISPAPPSNDKTPTR